MTAVRLHHTLCLLSRAVERVLPRSCPFTPNP